MADIVLVAEVAGPEVAGIVLVAEEAGPEVADIVLVAEEAGPEVEATVLVAEADPADGRADSAVEGRATIAAGRFAVSALTISSTLITRILTAFAGT